MISFKKFKPVKKVVMLEFTDQSQKDLQKWAISEGFDLTKSYSGNDQKISDFCFHTTIFYTTSEHVIENGTFEIENFCLKFKRFELLGPNKNVPVLKIDVENSNLLNIRKMFELQGFKDSWPEYKPHISLSYNWNGVPDLEKLSIPDIIVIADKISIQDQ